MDCFSITVCQDSALDKDSNNWSFYKIVEQVRVVDIPALLPFHTIVYLKPDADELNMDFNCRLVFVAGNGQEFPAAEAAFRTQATPRMRIRMQGFPIERTGYFQIYFEWRHLQTEEWTRSRVYWPIDIEQGDVN